MLLFRARFPLIGPDNLESLVPSCPWGTFETYAKPTHSCEEFDHSDTHYLRTEVKVIEDLDPSKVLNRMI